MPERGGIERKEGKGRGEAATKGQRGRGHERERNGAGKRETYPGLGNAKGGNPKHVRSQRLYFYL